MHPDPLPVAEARPGLSRELACLGHEIDIVTMGYGALARRECSDGVTVHPTPGHTPGHQSVRVRTAEGWAVLAVDAAYVFRSLESMIPPGIHVRADHALHSLDLIKDLADKPTLIFPGHDEEILKKFLETHPGVRQLV